MKSRIIWAAVVLAAVAGFYFVTIRPAMEPEPRTPRLNRRAFKDVAPPEIPPPALPMPVFETPTLTPPALPLTPPPSVMAARPDSRRPMQSEVPIQPGATIDFSIGAPVVRSAGDDKEALERALKEMAEATKNVTFPPSPAARK